MSKKATIIAISLISVGLAAFGFGMVGAASDLQNPMSNLVSAIAQKFNLNENDVQTVFDEQRTLMRQQREAQREQIQIQKQQQFTERINQAVADGKLTQAQADAILAKKAELEVQIENFQNQTQEQRQETLQQRQNLMDSLRQWAIDNNIPQEYLPFVGFGMGRGWGKGFGGGSGMPCF